MGSFSMTCAVSGLPIESGTRVRFFLLTENSVDSSDCYVFSRWAPRCWPIRGRYNDYGSVKDFKEEAIQASWLRGFQNDLVERGWGENTSHDVPTYYDMSFDDLLDAVQEDRVRVRRTSGYRSPLLREIRELLRASGIHDVPRGDIPAQVLLNADEGVVRIRSARGTPKTSLNATEEVLQAAGYPLVQRRVNAAYSFGEMSLFVSPRDGVNPVPPREDDWLRVTLAMIREDVWQSIVATRDTSKRSPYEQFDLHRYEKAAVTAWSDARAAFLNDPLVTYGSIRCSQREAKDEYVSSMFSNAAFQREDMGSAFWHVACGDTSLLDVPAFLQATAEFYYIQNLLQEARYQWRPSGCSGPQYGGWAIQASLLSSFARIASTHLQKDDQEDDCFTATVAEFPKPSAEYIEVVCALITDKDGRTLMARRRATSLRPGMWEMPGGKVDAGDSDGEALWEHGPGRHRRALERELKEELGVEARVGPLVSTASFLWEKPCSLFLYHCEILSGEPQPLEADALQYVDPRTALNHLPLCPAQYDFYPRVQAYIASLRHDDEV